MAAAVTDLWPETVGLAEVARGPVQRRLVADEAVRRRIAKGLDLMSLDSLEAEVDVRPWLDGAEVEGRWRAALVQECVVSLEPVPAVLEGTFTLRVVPEGSPAAPRETDEVEMQMSEEDPPDVLEGDRIDVGHYVVEHLALEIDPFPRAPGAEFDAPEPEQPPSPFAVLGRLKASDQEG
jgi:uncharacterized metal-binding protein YceD (DUF177 family)